MATKGELRRESLLDTAEHVLVTAGNANASMRSFAAAADVRMGHLQHYFPTRSDLMQAVLERFMRRSLASMRQATGIDLEQEDDAPLTSADTQRIATALLEAQCEPTTARLYVEIWAMAASDESIATELRGFYASYAKHVRRVVERARPELSHDARDAKAHSIIALLEGAVISGAAFAGLRSAGTDTEIIGAINHLIHGA
ncbi:TetR/AcrR family transcriptional regulator [Zhihengliuella flava]|uniref:AcrR family transcriptional regulator n=1 Tax=Zhihengliuella flava TaxID=1285193 RepID=A0A931GF86_9MICC|nr:TetR family transcriptional regulator C-terminal domain-containing protein [Zhihengliuella flava]MBG6084392.1 AcrR family transcriptional regulator [Zhihengliuella flava]